jgi:hypothetical protein
MERLRVRGRTLPHVFVPALTAPFGWAVKALAATPRSLGLSGPASLLRVFWPYVVFDTVFDNRRVVEEMGEAPPAFSDYAPQVIDFALANGFSYPYRPWPERTPVHEVVPSLS